MARRYFGHCHAPEISETTKALFLGDSLIEWWQQEGISSWEKYFQKYNAINIGVAGHLSRQTLKRLQSGILGNLKGATVSILLVGTNGIGVGYDEQHVCENIIEIIGYLQSNLPGTKVLLLGILPNGSKFRKMGKVNQLLATLDNGSLVKFLDMAPAFVDIGPVSGDLLVNEKFFAPDKLHLSKEGYEVWAQEMLPLFTEMVRDFDS